MGGRAIKRAATRGLGAPNSRGFLLIYAGLLVRMILDITDALPLILERSGRRTELQIPTMHALLYTRRNLWRRRDGYSNRSYANRNGQNHGVGRGVDDRDGVGD